MVLEPPSVGGLPDIFVIFVTQTHYQLVVYQEAVVALKLLVEHIFCEGRTFEGVSFYSFIKEQARKPRSYASSKLRLTHSLTYSLTGVKCRATSVAKNLAIPSL